MDQDNMMNISAPVGPYSPPEAIIAWVSELESMPYDAEVQSSIEAAKTWLEVQKDYMSIA